jgi:hypothetical protein
VDPVSEVRTAVEPVSEAAKKTIGPVVKPVEQAVDPVVEPVRETLDPSLEPLREKLETVEGTAAPIIDPVLDPALVPLVDPVDRKAEPVVDLINTPPVLGTPDTGLTAPEETIPHLGGGAPSSPVALGGPSFAEGGIPQSPAGTLDAAALPASRPGSPGMGQGAAVLNIALPTAGSSGPSAAFAPGGLRSSSAVAAARLALEPHALGTIETQGLLRPFERFLSGTSPGTSIASPMASGSPSQAPPPVSSTPVAPAGSSSGGLGLGGGSSSGAGLLLGCLALALVLSPFGRWMLRCPPEFIAPTSALNLAIERPG